MEDHPLAATFAEQAVADTRISLQYLKDVCPDMCQANTGKHMLQCCDRAHRRLFHPHNHDHRAVRQAV